MSARTIKSLFFSLLLFIGMNSGQSAFALTLGLPDISFDSSQGPGANIFTTQGTSFDAATGLLAVSAAATSITFDGVTHTPIVGGTVDYQALLTSQTSNPYTVTGNFGTSGANPDLILQGTEGSLSGVLLTGNIISLSITGLVGTNVAPGQAVFQVTGGLLAGNFGPTGGLVSLDFNVDTAFSPSTFTQNFTGQVKGDIATVPLSTSGLLMGSGLILLTLLVTPGKSRIFPSQV